MTPIVGRPRRRASAILLSILLPGLGELYAGEPRRAALTFFAYWVAVALSIVSIFLPLSGPAAALPFGVMLVAWLGIAVRAAGAAARASQPYALQPYNQWYWYLTAILISALVLQPAVFEFVRSRLVQAFRIPSEAMHPTLLAGDFIFVSKRPVTRPDLDDIIILESPTNGHLYVIKRVAGLPGDTLAMTNGALIRNGIALNEPFTQLVDSIGAVAQHLGEGDRWQVAHLAGDRARSYRPNMRNWGPIIVPADSVFVLGDNRDSSYDSRFWGAVGIDRLGGRPLQIYFSVGRDEDGHSSIRWNRIGRRF